MSEPKSAQPLKEERREEESHQPKGDLENKDLEEKKEDHHTITLSDPSPSVSPYSPPTPPSLRSRKPPSPPLHSSSDSSISDDHFSINHALSPPHDKHFSPPPQSSPPPGSSSESSIPDDHCFVSDGIPPIVKQHNSPPPTQEPASPIVVANRFQVETRVVTKVDPGAEKGVVGVGDAEEESDMAGGQGGGSSSKRRLRPDMTSILKSKKEAKLNKILLGLRIIGLVFCLISFSVLAADRKQGWALDSFYFYKEFRYSLSVNAIGFVYSLLQTCDLIKYFITQSYTVEHHLRKFFNFAMDQILTYLLMSASSSAATRAYDWKSNWGEDKFPDMANASVGLSFAAFTIFALSSIVSGYILCKLR